MENFLTEARQSDEKWRIIGTDLQIQDDESESREQYKNSEENAERVDSEDVDGDEDIFYTLD